MKERERNHDSIRWLAVIGAAAATVECGKLALSAIPNVEVVTLLLALYGYVFGSAGIVASLLFVAIEPLIYGFAPWVVTYFLYWPLVAVVFCLLGRINLQNRAVITLIAVLLTVWFGVLSSLVDVGLFTGYWDDFFPRFGILYARGLPFYFAEIATNALLFPFLFRPLSTLLHKLRRRMFPRKSCQDPEVAPDSDPGN